MVVFLFDDMLNIKKIVQSAVNVDLDPHGHNPALAKDCEALSVDDGLLFQITKWAVNMRSCVTCGPLVPLSIQKLH